VRFADGALLPRLYAMAVMGISEKGRRSVSSSEASWPVGSQRTAVT